MKTLILSCNTGEGHNSASAAMMDVFEINGETCERADTLSFLSKWVSKIICQWHTRIYRYMPRAFDVGYRAAEEHPDALVPQTKIYRFLTMGTKKLYKFIVDGGYDTIICPHVFSAILVTALRDKHPELSLTTCFIATDYTCSPMVCECKMDLFIVPDESLREDFISKGVPPTKILATGIPVRQAFFTSLPKDKARVAYGIPADAKHILMMCGSMGCGPMETITQMLSEKASDHVILTVICGTNKRLFKKLSKQFAGCDNVRVCGFVSEISSLMDTADLYLTKPGGISVTESAVKHLPMVFVDAVAGCEEYNLRFFCDAGMAVAPENSSPEDICACCLDLLKNDERIAAMREKMQVWYSGDAAAELYRQLKTMTNEIKQQGEVQDV